MLKELAPNPESAVDVLAFVLCPPSVFSTDPAEHEQVIEVMRPIKRAAIRRWALAAARGKRV
jgi:hypothetical protein